MTSDSGPPEIREAALRAVAAEAGFSQVRRVDVDAPLNILLQLRP